MDPFVGELRLFPWDFAPRGWALCQGQILPISQNQVLFALLGTTYGGNGVQTFALPDLRGRTPVGVANTAPQGSIYGSEQVTLTINTMPQHTHVMNTSSATAAFQRPPGYMLGVDNSTAPTGANFYGPATNLTTLAPSTVATAGASQAHTNMQPYLVLNYCIALQGLFPSRN